MRYALSAAVLVAVLAIAAPVAMAQTPPDYQPAPQSDYQPDNTGAAPDDDSGAPDDEAAPDDDAGAGPDTGAGAPGNDTRALPSGTLPLTGSEEVIFLSMLGFVLLLGGFAVRRSLRPLGH